MIRSIHFKLSMGVVLMILSIGAGCQAGGKSVGPVASASPAAANTAAEVPPSPAPQQGELPMMLKMIWSAGPFLPFGAQDKRIGLMDHWMVCAGGFCSGAGGTNWNVNGLT